MKERVRLSFREVNLPVVGTSKALLWCAAILHVTQRIRGEAGYCKTFGSRFSFQRASN